MPAIKGSTSKVNSGIGLIFNLSSILYLYSVSSDLALHYFGLISVLRPFNTFKAISSAVSYPNHTVSGQASKAVYQLLVHILLPVTDNCSS